VPVYNELGARAGGRAGVRAGVRAARTTSPNRLLGLPALEGRVLLELAAHVPKDAEPLA
jgi:hypothetical protein